MPNHPRHVALIVDDEPDICELAQITLQRMEIDSASAGNLAQARAMLAQQRYDVCLCDMRLPDGDGIDFVRYVHESHPDLPIAMITAHGNMESAIQALKAGAFDFVSKPVDLHVLRNLVNQALKLSDKLHVPPAPVQLTLLGNSSAIAAIRATAAKLARSQAPVYISGESGTGKELVARMIHEQGPRADRPFVPVNCGAIPEALMESEFFGHKKGSFTGAIADKVGLFQAADGGTLFLDEVADLPLPMQVKLLRAIQEKSVRAVGAAREVPVDVRILSATHKDLAQLVKDGTFRQDLFYRINVIELHLPSLRERVSDIPLLATNILERMTGSGNSGPKLSHEAIEALCRYPFPGNVRELENILERAVTLCDGNTITDADLNLRVAADESEEESTAIVAADDSPLEDYLDTIEKERILKALEETKYNKTKAAKLLGITFRALRYRLKKLGLE
jgi:two-component system response regulator PilR (NtrC family)